MKKILMLIAAMAFGLFGLAAPASATNDNHPEVSGKPVTVCHKTGSASNPYVKLDNVPLVQFIGPNGHAEHEGDIWAAFSYIVRTGPNEGDFETVNVPAQGDTALLAFDKCKQPIEDTPVTKPEVVFNDLCGTKNDTFSVAPGEGYTVGAVQHTSGVQRIVVTLAEGFKWSDQSTDPVTFERPEFTNVDCGLPETGAAEYATLAGWLSLSGAVVLGSLLLIRRRTV